MSLFISQAAADLPSRAPRICTIPPGAALVGALRARAADTLAGARRGPERPVFAPIVFSRYYSVFK